VPFLDHLQLKNVLGLYSRDSLFSMSSIIHDVNRSGAHELLTGMMPFILLNVRAYLLAGSQLEGGVALSPKNMNPINAW
jgi:hypothetical protein